MEQGQNIFSKDYRSRSAIGVVRIFLTMPKHSGFIHTSMD